MATTVLPSFFVKTSSGVFLEQLADGVNLSRKAATIAQGAVLFTRGDVGAAVTIPVGTLIQTATLNDKIYQLISINEASFKVGEATLNVAVKAAEAGADFNLGAGYYSILPVPIANIVAVTNEDTWLVVPGANIETDDELRARIRNQWGVVSDFHTDSVYKSLMAQFAGVNINAIWFEHDAPRGPGTANAYILFDFAAPIASYLSDINDFITAGGHHGHGDDLQVWQLPEQTQTLTTTVWHNTDLTAAQISQLSSDVTDFINAAFRENSLYNATQTLPYSRFSLSRLAQEIHAQFEGLHSIDFDIADIVTALWVPRLTSLTVTLSVTES